MTLTILIIVAIVGAFIAETVRRVRRMECYRDPTTGETWEPRFLVLMYSGSAHRGADGRMWHGNSQSSISDGDKSRAIWWGHILIIAEAYGIPVEDTSFLGEDFGCAWCRTYDLKNAPKRRREVLYAMSSMLVEQCREAGVPACARIIGERDSRPFGVGSFSQFFDSNEALTNIKDAVLLVLAHANIPQMANQEPVLHRLLRRPIAADECLDGLRWFMGESKRAA